MQDLPGLMTLVATVIDVRPYINFPLTPVSSSTRNFLVFYIYREWLITTHYHRVINTSLSSVIAHSNNTSLAAMCVMTPIDGTCYEISLWW